MSWFSDITDRYVLKKAYKWGKRRARAKLSTFHTYSNAYPDLSKERLYYLTVLTSADFNEYRTQQLVARAKEQSEGYISSSLPGGEVIKVPIPGEPFCLRSVVKMMLSAEERKLFNGNGFPHPDSILEAWQAVDDVISTDL